MGIEKKKSLKNLEMMFKWPKLLEEVPEKMFKRATGYTHPDVDIKVIENKIVVTKLKKHYPPDTKAGIFWLTNRQKKVWRDKQEIGVTDNKGKDVKQVFVIGGKKIEF